MEENNNNNNNNKNNGEEQGMFLTLASPSMPVPLAPKSFQVWRETTPPPPSHPSDSNMTVLIDSSADDGESSGPKKLGFINYEVEPGLTIRLRHNIDYDMDPRKLKRVISNRVSAQKSRIKKLQYVADLEKKHKELEMQVAVLRPQVGRAREHKRFVEMKQRDLNLRIAACHEHYRRTEAEIEAKKVEFTRLMRKLASQQQERGFDQRDGNEFVWGNGLSQPFEPNQNPSEPSAAALMIPYSLLQSDINMPPPRP